MALVPPPVSGMRAQLGNKCGSFHVFCFARERWQIRKISSCIQVNVGPKYMEVFNCIEDL